MHRQLIGIVSAAMALLLITLVVPLLVLIDDRAEQQVIAEATSQAVAVAAVVDSLTEAALSRVPVGGVSISIFRPDGRILGVPAERTEAVRQAAQCMPATLRTGAGVALLVPAGGSAGCGSVVRVHLDDRALHRRSMAPQAVVLALSAAMVLCGMLVAERLGRGLLRSVRDLAAAADRMAAGDLSARVPPTGPAEIRTAAAQLNRLAVRVDHLLHEQRQRAADIAHRLRTPMTSLRLDIDTVSDPPTRHRLLAGHDAVITALDEVIRTSRRAVTPTATDPLTDLAATVVARARFWAVLAQAAGRAMHVDVLADRLPVPVARKDLEAALDALIGNVLTHTPARVPLWLTAGRTDDGGAVLTVDDAGPGFVDLNPPRGGHSTHNSTGLGLDIARRAAEGAGGSLRLGCAPQGGGRVELRFPAAPPTR